MSSRKSIPRRVPISKVVYIGHDGKAMFFSPEDELVLVNPDGSMVHTKEGWEKFILDNPEFKTALSRWTGGDPEEIAEIDLDGEVLEF